MQEKFNLLSFQGKYRILHLTWFAFFMAFVMWMGFGAIMPFIKEAFGLSDQQTKVLLILNVAMTIPARIVVGMLVDKFGPRIMFSGILIFGGLISITFSLAQTYEQLAIIRFFSGFIGAGFVVGIRIISEWFPTKQTGIAQGIYGGWGNFGSAGGAIILPFLALLFDNDGWRFAIIIVSIFAIIYGVIYYINVRNTPADLTYEKPKKSGAMEVGSVPDLLLYIFMNIPLYMALAVLTWKLSPSNTGLISAQFAFIIYLILLTIFALHTYKILHVNIAFIKQSREKEYKFKQVAILSMGYLITFGIEISIVSFLALFYIDWFGLSKINAVLLLSIYPFLNLFARPFGGLISDKIGRKLTIIIAFCGITSSFLLMSMVEKNWSISAIITLTLISGLFSQAGSGSIFAMAPLIQKRLTGQISGMVGAFGNVGAVLFLTLNSFVDYDQLFLVIGLLSLAILVLVILGLDDLDVQKSNKITRTTKYLK